MSVTFPADEPGEGGVDGGVGDGGVVITGVAGCNKPVIAEFRSKFNADREPPEEEAEPLPAEATGRLPAALANGEDAVGLAAAELVEVIP